MNESSTAHGNKEIVYVCGIRGRQFIWSLVQIPQLASLRFGYSRRMKGRDTYSQESDKVVLHFSKLHLSSPIQRWENIVNVYQELLQRTKLCTLSWSFNLYSFWWKITWKMLMVMGKTPNEKKYSIHFFFLFTQMSNLPPTATKLQVRSTLWKKKCEEEEREFKHTWMEHHRTFSLWICSNCFNFWA